jgi:hypothetical protein
VEIAFSSCNREQGVGERGGLKEVASVGYGTSSSPKVDSGVMLEPVPPHCMAEVTEHREGFQAQWPFSARSRARWSLMKLPKL